MVDGLVLEQKISHLAGGVSSVEKAKIGLIQFCLSAPKTDVCSSVHVFLILCTLCAPIFNKFVNEKMRTHYAPIFLIQHRSRDAYAPRTYFLTFFLFSMLKMDNQVIV